MPKNTMLFLSVKIAKRWGSTPSAGDLPQAPDGLRRLEALPSDTALFFSKLQKCFQKLYVL